MFFLHNLHLRSNLNEVAILYVELNFKTFYFVTKFRIYSCMHIEYLKHYKTFVELFQSFDFDTAPFFIYC